jgi:hypothetical protein
MWRGAPTEGLWVEADTSKLIFGQCNLPVMYRSDQRGLSLQRKAQVGRSWMKTNLGKRNKHFEMYDYHRV